MVLALSCPAPKGHAADAPPRPTHLVLLTGPAGGQWAAMGDSIAETLTRSVLPTVHRMGSGVNNITSLSNHQGDFAFTLTCFLGAAESGQEEYRAIVSRNTAVVANIYPQALYFLMRKDAAKEHGITSVGTLLEKKGALRFASLKPGSASEFILNLLFKHGYGTNFDKLRAQGWKISFNTYAETADDFASGKIDCFAWTAGVMVPLIKTLEEHTDIVILPVEQPVLDRLTAMFKTGVYTIKPGDYKGVVEPVHTLGDYTCLVARKDLPDDIMFAATKALWENRKGIAEATADFGLLSPRTAMPANQPIHPGAAEFWKQTMDK
jgi:TRAP transporter TAXI family solute receptor